MKKNDDKKKTLIPEARLRKIIQGVSNRLKKPLKDVTQGDILAQTKVTTWQLRYSNFTKIHHSMITEFTESHPYSKFTREEIGEVVKKYNIKKGRFFVTAAVAISELDYPEHKKDVAAYMHVVAKNVNLPALKSVKNFLKRQKAELIVMPMNAHTKPLHSQPKHYDPDLLPYIDNFATEYIFNTHLKAVELKINPQQIKPLTGLFRIRGYEDTNSFKTSMIVAHTKQDLETLATGNNSHPRILHSTGVITLPRYQENRIGKMAKNQHVMGGLIVEIDDDKFWIRQVQFCKDGSFFDSGIRYYADGSIKKERVSAIKLGDIHAGHEDETVLKAWGRVFNQLNPRSLFYEDFFDASSITYHLRSRKISKARLDKHFSSLQSEINYARSIIYKIKQSAPKDCENIITASNHPEMVDRYLDECQYIHESQNFDIGARMTVMKLDGKNPLQEYIDPDGLFKWLGQNEDLIISNVNMASHGHLAGDGGRNTKNLEKILGNAIVAHLHTPFISGKFMIVGHSSQKRHGYNNGPSSWVPACGIVTSRGEKQLIMCIDGRTGLDDNT